MVDGPLWTAFEPLPKCLRVVARLQQRAFGEAQDEGILLPAYSTAVQVAGSPMVQYELGSSTRGASMRLVRQIQRDILLAMAAQPRMR